MKTTKESKSPVAAIQADTDKLVKFLSMYCRAHHKKSARSPFIFKYKRLPATVNSGPELCRECGRLLRHAIVMRALCPLDPKPKCRRCPQHCYLPKFRDDMEKVMKYAGPRYIFNRS